MSNFPIDQDPIQGPQLRQPASPAHQSKKNLFFLILILEKEKKSIRPNKYVKSNVQNNFFLLKLKSTVQRREHDWVTSHVIDLLITGLIINRNFKHNKIKKKNLSEVWIKRIKRNFFRPRTFFVGSSRTDLSR